MTGRTASLAMYSLEELRPRYQRLWDAVVERLPDLPPDLTWPEDVRATWTDDGVAVKQACGWPLVTQLVDTVRVVGAFHHDVDGAEGHRYRSVVVANEGARLGRDAASTAAYNSRDSLSGWVSLLAWSGRSATSLRSGAVRTGSHVASLEALQGGRADHASIDAVTLAHVRRHRPELTTGLHVIGWGPLVPSLPVVVPASADDAVVHGLRDMFRSVVADVALSATCEALHITGFEPLELDDYRRELDDFAAS